MASPIVASLPGQGPPPQPPPTRLEYLFHIYVDPLFGDDALATILNPSTLNPQPPTPPVSQNVPLRPLDFHPEPAFQDPLQGNAWVWPITGFLHTRRTRSAP